MLKFDPHIHSIYSHDANSKIEDILKIAIKKNFDAIAISDHNSIKGSKLAIEQSKNFENFLIIPSIEISTSKGHILGLNISEIISKGLEPEETIDLIHDLGGLAIIPHPYSFYRHGLFSNADYKILNFDGIETLNGKYFIGFSNYRAKLLAKKHNIPGLGASDSHNINTIGSTYTLLDCDLSCESILKAIKNNKVKAMGKGNSYIRKYIP